MKNRYFIKLSYNGANYHGWQMQPGVDTIQSVIEAALKTLLKEDSKIMGAGRTDTGVHAKEFFAHFNSSILPTDIKKYNIAYKLNCILPGGIAIHEIIPVKENAHARFDALSRTYNYFICTKKDPFWQERAWFLFQEIDMQLVNEATEKLFDFSDFSSFSKTNTQTKTNICNIVSAQWEEKGHIIKFKITADRFLRNMVRAVTGTLVDVGLKKLSINDFVSIIESKNRCLAGVSAPAQGLYLTEVKYPASIFLAEKDQEASDA